MSDPALLDTSAWARLADGRLSGASAEPLLQGIAAGTVALCPPLILEIRYSARDGASFGELALELESRPSFALTANACEQAMLAQADLAADRRVSHGVKPVDLLIAAVASENELAVIHYDHDYDVVAAHTRLRFTSRWIAPRGSLSS